MTPCNKADAGEDSELCLGGETRIGPTAVDTAHGARYSWDLAYRNELIALSRECSNISYIPVVSKAEDDPIWGGLTGFLQDVLLSGEVERRTGVTIDPAQTHVFLCGNPLMVEEAKKRLVTERGYLPDHRKEVGTVHLEEYW